MNTPTRAFHASCLILAIAGGCQSASRRSLPSQEPGLSSGYSGGPAAVVEPPAPTQPTSFVDRHPLLARPKQVYDSTNNNKVVKTAAATVVGVPSGIVGELRQIFIGEPGASNPR